MGPLGLGSPRFRTEVAPCPAVLCVATTAFVLPGRFACRSLPVPWVDALFFVSLPTRAGVGSSAGRVGQRSPGCCLCRSPLLRLLLPRRREALPSSRVPRSQTPVVSRPLALTRTGLLPSGTCIPSALGSVSRTYLLTTIIHFSEFNDAACVLAFPLLRTPLLSGRTSVQLPTWWLAFGRVGLEYSSHPLGNFDMFQEVSPLSSHPEFSSARACAGFGTFFIVCGSKE